MAASPTKSKDMKLESWSFAYAEYILDGPVISVTLLKQDSKSECTLGKSFGFTGNKVWVNHGARGTFRVVYNNPTGNDFFYD